MRGSSIALATGEIDLDITRSKEPPTHDIADGGSARRLRPVKTARARWLYRRSGHDLQRLRRQRKLSQADLARLIDPNGDRLSRSSIANIENGKQRVALHLFLDLAKALKVDPKDLLPDQPADVPNIVGRAQNLTQPEQDWLARIVANPTRRRATKAKTKVHGT